jgi:hypothetical protein
MPKTIELKIMLSKLILIVFSFLALSGCGGGGCASSVAFGAIANSSCDSPSNNQDATLRERLINNSTVGTASAVILIIN